MSLIISNSLIDSLVCIHQLDILKTFEKFVHIKQVEFLY